MGKMRKISFVFIIAYCLIYLFLFNGPLNLSTGVYASESLLDYEPNDGIEKGDSNEENTVDVNESIPRALLDINPRKMDPSLWISYKLVTERIKDKQEIVFIDIRTKEEFEKSRIPGSLNIPLYAIKTKNYLKPKSVVLVNEGYNFGQLEKECRQLRDFGFIKTSILAGGLYSWMKNGSILEGDAFVQKDLNKIDPGDFFPDKDYEEWVIIDVTASEESDYQNLIPQAIHIPYINDEEQFIPDFKTAITRHSNNNAFRNILITNASGEQYEEIERLIQKSGIVDNIFYLKGGLKGYMAFLRKQVLIHQQEKRVKKTTKKCSFYI